MGLAQNPGQIGKSTKWYKGMKAANEVDMVLSKSIKKKTGPVEINISLKKVLEGGNAGKAFKKFVDKSVKRSIGEITKKLNIPMPKLLIVDELKNELTRLKKETVKFLDNSKIFSDCCGKLRKADSAIAADFAKLGVKFQD